MSQLEFGLTLMTLQDPVSGETPRWDQLRHKAVTAEAMGFDTVWIPDELLWKVPDWPGPRGWWECVAMAGAVAASTSTITVGTWVLSTLHRNPGLTAKVAETLDEIAGGRFLLGLGSGHSGIQGEAFGYPPDKVVSRYAEALEIIVALLRTGHTDYDGVHHRATDLEHIPHGPRPGAIPIMLGGHGPRTMRLAVDHADIWSAYATESSLPEAFRPMLGQLDGICGEAGRDPSTLGRSIGVFVETTDDHSAEEIGLGVPIAGSSARIAETIAGFGDLGVTRVEINLWPPSPAALEAFAPVLEALTG